MSVIEFNVKQFRKLVVDGFDHLANAVEKSSLVVRKLYFLVGAWQRHQADAIVGERLCI